MNQPLYLSCPNQACIEIACLEQNAPLRAADQMGHILELGIRPLQFKAVPKGLEVQVSRA